MVTPSVYAPSLARREREGSIRQKESRAINGTVGINIRSSLVRRTTAGVAGWIVRVCALASSAARTREEHSAEECALSVIDSCKARGLH